MRAVDDHGNDFAVGRSSKHPRRGGCEVVLRTGRPPTIDKPRSSRFARLEEVIACSLLLGIALCLFTVASSGVVHVSQNNRIVSPLFVH